MTNNIIHVHNECCVSQINIKLLSLNVENETFEHTSWRHNMYRGPKMRGGVLQIEGVLQLGGIWYV